VAKKMALFIYYAYGDDNTKKWYLYNSPSVNIPGRFLLFELQCIYSDVYVIVSPDKTQPVIGGNYLTTDNKWIKVIDRKWYGIKYRPKF
jgi:hypothetical protein